MKVLSQLGVAIAACCIGAASAHAQINLPRIVQLPTEDFTWVWGDNVSVDDRERPDFDIDGVELPFSCSLVGAFRPSSRMSDYYSLREFEQALLQTLYFIQQSAAILNDLYVNNDLDWAILECAIADASDSEEARQDRLGKAVERAEKQRERRREREARREDE